MNLRKQLFFSMLSIYFSQCLMPLFFPEGKVKTVFITALIILMAINMLWSGCTLVLKSMDRKPLIYAEKRQTEKTGREFGMDIARIIAILFVPLIHFFGNTGFYSAPMEGKDMFAMTALRWLVLNAVPMFMIITGYFKTNKKIGFEHYIDIIPVLMTHIVCSAIRLYTDFHIHGVTPTREYILDKLLYFDYGWYVKLYIGLMLLIPFLNKAYHALSKREEKEGLIITIMLLTATGPLLYDVIPKTWLIIYVLGYYFIGSYIREYKIKINPVVGIFLLALIVLSAAFGSYFRSRGGAFDWNYLGYADNSAYSSLPAFLCSSLIIILVSDVECKSAALKTAAKTISIMSLEMYLFSQMFDMIIYKPYQSAGYLFEDYLSFAPRLIFCIIFFSFLASAAKKLVFFIPSVLFKSLIKSNERKDL